MRPSRRYGRTAYGTVTPPCAAPAPYVRAMGAHHLRRHDPRSRLPGRIGGAAAACALPLPDDRQVAER
ncbi:hypothetical protein Mro03_27860 [Microbispora rosea subsp. rosea]|nr:hypothetical protein Mro03_27860 [Microbispora rosea subsp. rosea]